MRSTQACESIFGEQLIRAAMRRENPKGFSRALTPKPKSAGWSKDLLKEKL